MGKEESSNSNNKNDGLTSSNLVYEYGSGQRAIFGEKRIIPYSINNIKTALSNVMTKSYSSVADLIQPTHSYVKFTFMDDNEYNSVRRLGVEMSFIPYDIDIVRGGFVIDEGLPNGVLIRYAIIPVGIQNLIDNLGISCDIIDPLFIPEEVDDITTKSGYFTTDVIDKLVEEAFVISGNADWISSNSIIETKTTMPAGQITYLDTVAVSYSCRTIGMEGLTVKAKRPGKTASAICDPYGYFRCDKEFKYKWTYETDFERYDFQIRYGTTGNLAYVTEKTDEPWSLFISDRNSPGYFISTVFRACAHYYYGDIDGLRRPPQNSFWNTQLHVAAIFEDDPDGNYGDTNMARRFLGIGNAIHVYKDFDMINLYDTVIHELCHASHWEHSRQQYNLNTDEMDRLRESLANGIARYLTDIKYPGWTGLNYYDDKVYTHIVDDLIDDHICELPYGKLYPDDLVSGYTIRQVEDAAVGASSTSVWKNNLYNTQPVNSSRDNLDALFRAWYE